MYNPLSQNVQNLLDCQRPSATGAGLPLNNKHLNDNNKLAYMMLYPIAAHRSTVVCTGINCVNDTEVAYETGK